MGFTADANTLSHRTLFLATRFGYRPKRVAFFALLRGANEILFFKEGIV